MGDSVGQVAAAHTVLDFTLVVDVLFVCVYVLTAALFLASLGRNRSDVRRSITAAPQSGSGERDSGESIAENVVRMKSEEFPVQGASVVERGQCVQKEPSSKEASRGVQQREEKPSAALRRSNGAAPMTPTDEPPTSLEERLSSLGLADPLSARECEVADLMRHGNTVATIAHKSLHSEKHGARGAYMKSIYRNPNPLGARAHRSFKLARLLVFAVLHIQENPTILPKRGGVVLFFSPGFRGLLP